MLGRPLMIVRDPDGSTLTTSPSDVEAKTPCPLMPGHMAMMPLKKLLNAARSQAPSG